MLQHALRDPRATTVTDNRGDGILDHVHKTIEVGGASNRSTPPSHRSHGGFLFGADTGLITGKPVCLMTAYGLRQVRR